MNKIIFSITIVLLLFFSFSIFGQGLRTIKGIVIDAKTSEGLEGASIGAANFGNRQFGTTTNKFGAFEISISNDIKKLKISLVGYKDQELSISNENTYKVTLEEGIILSEIVVTALGLERQSKSIGYSIQKIEGSEISKVKSANFLDNLAGRVAGLNITAGSTGVGSTTRISLRGESSFTNTNPLFVVDGIPVNNNTIVNNVNDDANGFMEVDFGNGAMDINPDDIESISVLKGPTAAALYGTRALNGVILIKSKTGSKNKGLGVSFNSTITVETPLKLPKFQNTYGLGNSGQFAFKNGLGAGINDNITYSYGPKADGSLLIPQFDSPVTLPDGSIVRGGDVAVHGGAAITPTPFVSFPDNLKDFYQTGNTFINNLAFSAGNERANFRLSLTDLNSKSIIPGVDIKRKTLSNSFSFSPTAKFKITSNLSYINTQSSNRPATKYGSENINYALVAWFGRSSNIESLKDYWQPGLENVQQYSYNYTFFDNPYFTLLENKNGLGRDRLFGNLSAKYDFTNDLSLTIRSGMDYQNEDRTFRRAFSSNRFKSGAYAIQEVNFREINYDFLLNYKKTIRDFNLDFAIGGNRMDQKASMQQFQALSLAQPGVFSLSNAASPIEYNQTVGVKRINSFYGITKLAFKDFLFIDVNGRNDWSSSLATPTSTSNTSFFYPSIASGLVISNITRLPEIISFLKLRASYAAVGNDTNPFQTVGTFVAKTPVGGLPAFTDQSQIANANLKPESITSVEFGTDIRLFNDKVKIDLSYFNALNKNQIISLPIANSSGYTQQNINGGSVRSKGFEAIVSITPIQKNNFVWNTTLNFTTYKNIIESLPKEAATITLAYNSIYDNVNQTIWYFGKVGGRMGDFYGTGYLKNNDGDFIIGADGRYIVDNTLKKLGNYNPDFILGIYNTFSYKNIQASFLLDWHQGGQLVSRTLALAGVAGQLIETENRPEAGIVAKGVVNVGTAESPVYEPNTKALSAETYYRMYYDRNHEENNMYDASYLKLREFTIGYSLPKTLFNNRFQDISLSVVGRNLIAWSKIPHFDPEQFGFQGNKLVTGVEDMSYPTSRNVKVKVALTF